MFPTPKTCWKGAKSQWRASSAVATRRRPLLRGAARVDNAPMSEANKSVQAQRTYTFGQNLRMARRGAGISQDDLAKESGVDRTAISTYERGRREPNLRTIVRLARALGVEPAELLQHL